MFAAAADRVDVVKLLLARGADLDVTSRVEDFAALTMTNDADQNGVPRPQAPPPPGGKDIPGVTRRFNYNELIGKHGGLAALHFAARQGAMRDGRGAASRAAPNINQRGAGDQDHADRWSRRSTATSTWSATCSTTAPIRTWPAKAASRRSTR